MCTHMIKFSAVSITSLLWQQVNCDDCGASLWQAVIACISYGCIQALYNEVPIAELNSNRSRPHDWSLVLIEVTNSIKFYLHQICYQCAIQSPNQFQIVNTHHLCYRDLLCVIV